MNIALWIVQILLALMFLMAGSTKAFSYEKAKTSLPWVKDSSKGLVSLIGLAELLGGIGLILPYSLGIAPILTPI
ncbi:DoxX family protein, partial [Escherichia coli]|uniref:DoxX family protein n=1 Tax=Escherichia coli TaxID=562 RepID=UPI00307ADA72